MLRNITCISTIAVAAASSALSSDAYIRFYEHALDHHDKGSEYTVQDLATIPKAEWQSFPTNYPNSEVTGIEGNIHKGTIIILRDHKHREFVLCGPTHITTLRTFQWNDPDNLEWKLEDQGLRPPHTTRLERNQQVNLGWINFYDKVDLGGTQFKSVKVGDKEFIASYPPQIPTENNHIPTWKKYVVEFPGPQNDRTRSVSFNLPTGVFAVLTEDGKGKGKPVLLWGSGKANVQNTAWGKVGVSSLVFYRPS